MDRHRELILTIHIRTSPPLHRVLPALPPFPPLTLAGSIHPDLLPTLRPSRFNGDTQAYGLRAYTGDALGYIL
jgi:hypothetical protein